MSMTDFARGDAFRAGMLLRVTHQRKFQELDTALRPLGSTVSQTVLLLAIEANPGASAHDLAVATVQTDQSVGELLRRLVDAGLVGRTAGSGRVQHHALTPAGRDLLAECVPVIDRVTEAQFSVLSRDELTQLLGLLDRL